MTEAAAQAAPVEAPAAAPPQGEPEQPIQPRNAVEAIVAKHQQREAQKGKEAPAEGAAPAEGEKPKAEPDKPKEEGSSLQFAKLKKEHRELVAQKLELGGKVEALTKEADDFKALFARNPFKALEKVTGKSFKELVERGAKGEFDERGQLPPEVQAELEASRKWREEQKERETKAAKA